MKIREYGPEDLQELREIHAAQGFAYPFPDLFDPLFVTRLVMTEGQEGGEAEKIAGAALLRLTAEAYLLLDPRQGTPRERWERILALEQAAEADAWRRGLADVHAWLPPSIAAKFGRRLARRGWLRDDAWTPYCKRLTL